MLEILSAILFSIAANIDNIPIGISYGIKKIHIPFLNNIFISFITATFTFVSMYISKKLNYIINSNITNTISASILIILGIFPILKLIVKNKKENRGYGDNNKDNIETNSTNSNITMRESILIMFTLAINNIAIGVFAGITGVNIICTFFSSFIFGTLFLYFGNKLGKKIFRKLSDKYSVLISSLLLTLLGIIELIF